MSSKERKKKAFRFAFPRQETRPSSKKESSALLAGAFLPEAEIHLLLLRKLSFHGYFETDLIKLNCGQMRRRYLSRHLPLHTFLSRKREALFRRRVAWPNLQSVDCGRWNLNSRAVPKHVVLQTSRQRSSERMH
ncbi:hypothetical protein AVEN_56797-1 [Araneus ventricosus]|uniref:Uncharacterized protein n=1 Tax=Araneus ventricosus TaxID=182803 RepID=A0A4Y2H9Y4_ARAVE|nr:hypothetical protein AVEN_56797-1 [Araneus ventricosus]